MTSWIKIEVTLPEKEEVICMAQLLKMKDTDTVVGKLIRLWAWADLQTVNSNCVRCTDAFIDRIACCKGFANALRSVGWLGGEDRSLFFPNFERHNGETTKERIGTNRRVTQFRHKGNGESAVKTGKKGAPYYDGAVTPVMRNEDFCNGASVTDVTRNPLLNPLPEEEYRGKNERGREIPQSMGKPPLENTPSPPPPVSLKLVTGEDGELEPEFVAFVGWVKSLRPGWDAGRLSRRERTAAVRAFLELERPLSELERAAVPAYLEHEPPDGCKFDYPRDRELLFSRLGEVVQKAVAWFRRTGRRCPSEVERSREEAARRRAENARLAAQRVAMSPEVLIEQINGLRAAVGSPLLTEAEMEKIRKGERLHGDA